MYIYLHRYICLLSAAEKIVLNCQKMEIISMANEITSGDNEEQQRTKTDGGRKKKRILAMIILASFICMLIQCIIILLQKLDSETLTTIVKSILENGSKYFSKNETIATTI